MADEQPRYPESLENSDSSSSKAGPKRRASRAGTRSVASLTPEQLARKRANDREAQRSIRQRTKNHIEELEQRIQDLSENQDARNYEQIQRRNLELEEELRQLNEVLRRSEGSVASSPELTPVSSRYGMDILEERHPLSYSSNWISPTPIARPTGSFPNLQTSAAGDLLDHSGLQSGFSDSGSATSDTFESDFGFQDDAGSPLAMTPASRRGTPNSRPHYNRSSSFPHGRSSQSSSPVPGRMSGMVSTIGPSPLTGQPISSASGSMMMHASASGIHSPMPPTSHPSALTTKPNSHVPFAQQSGTTYEMPFPCAEQPAHPIWAASPCFAPPTGPLDSILIGLLQRQRNLARENVPGSAVIGPFHPDLKAIVNPEMSNKIHPVSSILSNLFQRISYPTFAERVASLFLTYHYCQWQIWPTMETFNKVPEWLRPRTAQLTTTHPIWVTLLTWGRLRDVVIENQEQYATEEFMEIYQRSLNINWPLGEQDILAFNGDDVRLSDAFIRHIETQANWSLDEPFQRRYPELRDCCRFSEHSAR